MTAKDYKFFGGQFQVLLDTIKSHYDKSMSLPL